MNITMDTNDEKGVPADSPWIALVVRGSCNFVQKVRAMQSSGAAAVVVGGGLELLHVNVVDFVDFVDLL
jgi:putative N-acetylmannosamine-6-phosphate epimerase